MQLIKCLLGNAETKNISFRISNLGGQREKGKDFKLIILREKFSYSSLLKLFLF
jgi:hypothetical protein